MNEICRVLKKEGYLFLSTLRQPSFFEIPSTILYLIFIKKRSVKNAIKIVHNIIKRNYTDINLNDSIANAKRYYPNKIREKLKKIGMYDFRIKYIGFMGIPIFSKSFMLVSKKCGL